MTTNILYYLKINKIKGKRKNRIFDLKDRLNLMKNPLNNDYFYDIKFKIIPKCYSS